LSSSYSYILKNFKGKYNLSVPYDLEKNEFPVEIDGEYSNYYDIRIDCRKGFIYHAGQSTLMACFDTINLRNRVLKQLDPSIIIEAEKNWYDFSFDAKDIEPVAKAMQAKISHKNRSPYSVKNLPQYVPNNAYLCKQVSKFIIDKYGIGQYNKVMQKYFRKYKIKYKKEGRLKYIHILDKHNKLQEVLDDINKL